MAREFLLPDIGEGLTEAEIVRWLVPEGERVEADQPVVEVETDKAVVEIPSPYAGTVLRHGGAEGETIRVGSVLVVIGEEGEAEVPTPDVPEPEPSHAAAPIVGSLDEEAEVLSPVGGTNRDEATAAVKALPIVRKLAREMGVDLGQVQGSGPEGRITREDVLAAGPPTETETPSREPSGHAVATASPSPVAGQDERRPLSRLRRTIAANMAKSWAEIPHVTTFDEVDATRLIEIKSALGARHDVKLPMEALVIKAVIPALEAFPEFNATLDGDDLIVHVAHHVGIAVDTPDGLLVAVIRDAGSRPVLDIASEVRRLGAGARERSLAPDELSGQTFTVSKIGAVGGGQGTPIVPYGTTAILSVGRAQEKVVVANGDLAIAPVMPLSLSYDHRVIDGAQGRRFMALVIENLEEPALFLAG
ncbi:MAG TPA: dihydrolipoamide acetyltransferase family protein [Acidimicrobiia bacterium]|nr:dihydrolipoamide acetyltransferase family protein [Acidimicrobiia bacterium]